MIISSIILLTVTFFLGGDCCWLLRSAYKMKYTVITALVEAHLLYRAMEAQWRHEARVDAGKLCGGKGSVIVEELESIVSTIA